MDVSSCGTKELTNEDYVLRYVSVRRKQLRSRGRQARPGPGATYSKHGAVIGTNQLANLWYEACYEEWMATLEAVV